MTRLQVLLTTLAVVAVSAIAFHWSPGRQVRLHQRDLQRAVEKRNWTRVDGFVAADYSDRWGQNRALALEHLPQVFQDFLAIGILNEDVVIRADGDRRNFQARVRIVGSGGMLARMVMDHVDGLKQPFTFTWRRQSWKPWDWQLVRIDQPEIEIPEADFP